MRTSHLEIKRRIEDEKKKISDQELFASKAFEAYLADLAETASKRYRRKIRVKTYWDIYDRNSAATDNRNIVMNTGNSIAMSFPTRRLKADCLIGMLAHEVGHVLFTNFAISAMYTESLINGALFPEEPKPMTVIESVNLEEMKEYLAKGEKIPTEVIIMAARNIHNILEDIYIEARMCHDFPGKFKTGIQLVNLRIPEFCPSIVEQLDNGVKGFSIMANLILQYCRTGDFNNLGDYKGEYIEAFESCVPVIDEAAYDDDSRVRYKATNQIVIKLWPYIKELVKDTEENHKNSGGSMDEEEIQKLLKELAEQLDKDSIKVGAAPKGKGKSAKAAKMKYDKEAEDDETAELQEVVEFETGRMELEKTDEISEGNSGGVSRNNFYSGSGYDCSEDDINRVLNTLAEDRAVMDLEQELTDELQAESDKIRYGNAHSGIHITINRMASLDPEMMESYKRVSSPLLLLSKRMQKQVMQALKDKKDGGKLTGLLMGKRLNTRSLVHNDGRYFYNNRLPVDEAELSVALLVDESGSMASNDRITTARAASIVIQDFCESLGIPVCIYGHSTSYAGVDLYAYSEFDSVDKKDRYRIMDMSARGSNRDGAALRFVCERLITRPEATKLLILISDGQPADRGYCGTEAEADLRGIKREYSNKGLKLFAAAIGDDRPNIERIYGDGFLDITDLSKLPSNLARLIIKHIK